MLSNYFFVEILFQMRWLCDCYRFPRIRDAWLSPSRRNRISRFAFAFNLLRWSMMRGLIRRYYPCPCWYCLKLSAVHHQIWWSSLASFSAFFEGILLLFITHLLTLGERMLCISSEQFIGIYTNLMIRLISLSQELMMFGCILLIKPRFLFARSTSLYRISHPDLLSTIILCWLNLSCLKKPIWPNLFMVIKF